MLLTLDLAPSRCSTLRASGRVCRRQTVPLPSLFRKKLSSTVALYGRRRWPRRVLTEGEVSSYTSDLVSAVRNAARGLDAPFYVSGHVRLQQPVDLSWVDSSSTYLARLPGNQREVEQLHSMCTQAVFGKGSETVCDTSYRRASALSDYSFESTFQPGEHGILEEIGETLGFQGVYAEQDKVNLYYRGDFFKPHVDTPAPRKDEGVMFGTLVLCLPSHHEGGELDIFHGPRQASTDWAAESGGSVVQWMAFYSDCPHEVRPVTLGTRLTISYKLFARPQDAATLLNRPSALSFQKALEIALQDPGFPPQGRSLGFSCQHLYPHADESWSSEHLKGCDAMIMAAAKNLGLVAQVVPVMRPDAGLGYYYFDDGYGGLRDNFMTGVASRLSYQEEPEAYYDECDESAAEIYLDAYNAGDMESRNEAFSMGDAQDQSWEARWELKNRKRNILWCSTAFKYHQLGLWYQAYGNESFPNESCIYTAAAIVIDIPSYEKRQKKV